MINIVIGILAVAMVLNCLLLILLVLVQLPKKEAGAGLAFGGAGADALFGAGSGNALTKITKYVATAFFVFAIMLSILYVRRARSTSSELEAELGKAPAQRGAPLPVLPTNALRTTASFGTNQPMTNTPAVPTNAPTPLPK